MLFYVCSHLEGAVIREGVQQREFAMDCLLGAMALSGAEANELLERSCDRARGVLAVVEAIDLGELFAETPASAAGRRRHDIGVALLDVLRRELSALVHEMASANPL